VGRCIRAGKFKGLALSIAALGQIYGGGGGGGGNSGAYMQNTNILLHGVF
jgi:hypothetical protein